MRAKGGMSGMTGMLTVLAATGLSGCGELTDDGDAEAFATIQSAVSSPNDPEFKKQWALNNSAQSIVIDAEDGDVQVGLRNVDMRLLKAWDTTQGSSNVIVAIIEQFDADLGHPDLVSSRWINTGEIPGNGIDDDHNGYRDDVFGYDFTDNEADVSDDLDESGHATHIGGIVGARKGNALGISGVAPGVRVMHLRAAANNPPAINAAIDYAKNNGARVVNLSQGGGPAYNIAAVRDKIAATSSLLFVCSAGNSAVSSFNFPSSYPAANILALASADNLGNLGRSSNFGEQHVDIAAPGVGIFSTLPGNAYDWKNGTSQAAANVSGVAALLLSSEPSLTPTQVIARLKATGMRVPLFARLMQAPAIVDAEAALANTLNVNLTATSVPGPDHVDLERRPRRHALSGRARRHPGRQPAQSDVRSQQPGAQLDAHLSRARAGQRRVRQVDLPGVEGRQQRARGGDPAARRRAAARRERPVPARPERPLRGRQARQPVDSPALHQGRHRGLRRPEPELRAAVL